MFTHEAPVELQRDHWKLNAIGAVPDQVPGWPVRILPSTGLPVTVGRDVFVGGPVAADAPAATIAEVSVAAKTSNERKARPFLFVRMSKSSFRREEDPGLLIPFPREAEAHADVLQKRRKVAVRVVFATPASASGRLVAAWRRMSQGEARYRERARRVARASRSRT